MLNNLSRLEAGLEPALRPLGEAIGRTMVDLVTPARPLKPYIRPDGTRAPHMFVDHLGKLVNLPPLPSAPQRAPSLAPEYQQKADRLARSAPAPVGNTSPAHFTVWKGSSPLGAGWYIASAYRKGTRIRYWDGKGWSADMSLLSAKNEEARARTMRIPTDNVRPIEWLRPLTTEELGG